jgi:hypothetical protein
MVLYEHFVVLTAKELLSKQMNAVNCCYVFLNPKLSG